MQVGGLTVLEVEAVTGQTWQRYGGLEEWVGEGAYVWIASTDEMIYPGSAEDVIGRLRRQHSWAESDDQPGTAAHSRLVTRTEAVAYYLPTATIYEARDVESLLAAANVHQYGNPPIGWGLAWLPTAERARVAWKRALAWAGGEAA